MNKSLYYLELTCIKKSNYPNVAFEVGDILYYNKKASSNEMYLYSPYINPSSEFMDQNHSRKYYGVCGNNLYLPFTRKKQNAKKWEIRRYAEQMKTFIEQKGEFKCDIKEIKVNYIEE